MPLVIMFLFLGFVHFNFNQLHFNKIIPLGQEKYIKTRNCIMYVRYIMFDVCQLLQINKDLSSPFISVILAGYPCPQGLSFQDIHFFLNSKAGLKFFILIIILRCTKVENLWSCNSNFCHLKFTHLNLLCID